MKVRVCSLGFGVWGLMFRVWVLGGFTWRLEISGNVAECPRVAIRDLRGVAGFRIEDTGVPCSLETALP